MWPTAKGTWNGAAAALAEQGENLLQKPWKIRRLQIMVRHLRAKEHMETEETHEIRVELLVWGTQYVHLGEIQVG